MVLQTLLSAAKLHTCDAGYTGAHVTAELVQGTETVMDANGGGGKK